MNWFYRQFKRHLPQRIYVLVAAHIVLFVLSYQVSLWLRFDMNVPRVDREAFWKVLPWLIAVKLLMFQWFGSLHGWWRYITFHDLAALLKATTMATVVVAFVDYVFLHSYQIPRAVVLLDWVMTLLLIGGVRSACRLVREIWWPAVSLHGRKPALLIGAVQGGEVLARQINSSSKLDFRVVGFLDEKRSTYGTRLGGIPFVGTPHDAVECANQHGAKDLLVISDSLSGKRLRELMARCRKANIRIKMIPPVDDLVNGSFRIQVRDVDINDVLRRDPVQLDLDAIDQMLAGKRVMVTGAGGSIGSEICRQILKSNPDRLILVERSENSLFLFERELSRHGYESVYTACIADICDEHRMRSLFELHRPEIVFHAAAHKHVPLMEDNPSEAVKNNVLGTAELAALCDEYAVERFVMISTDKAVNPTSIMGVSKQLAERFVHARNEVSETKFVVVRFGNVLASAGSVVPTFQDQIKRGGPVTVTHPAMTRFFMTIPEASQLVLQASSMGDGGEIFVLDMGEQVKIVDLAKDLIRLSGFSLEEIKIEFVGVRPGEKMFEELYMTDEEMMDTDHPKVSKAYHNQFGEAADEAVLDELRWLTRQPATVVRQRLAELAINYQPAADEQALVSQPEHLDQLDLSDESDQPSLVKPPGTAVSNLSP